MSHHRYVITVSMLGYVPESDLVVCETATSALEYMRNEVDRFADQDAIGEPTDELMAQWDDVLENIDLDLKRADDQPDYVSYWLPGPLIIEAQRFTIGQLIGMGYEPDFHEVNFDAAGLVAPTDAIENYEPPRDSGLVIHQEEASEAITELYYREAYGRDAA
jgi:hypothetical protein